MSVIRKSSRAVTVKLPQQLEERLAELAEARNCSRSDLVREALVAYVSGTGPSALAAAADLVGAFEGPADLSTNSRYLDDFGR